MIGIVSSSVIVTLSLRRAVFPIFDSKNAVTLKTGLGVRQGHWKYHHSTERIYDFLKFLFYSNYDSRYLVSFLRYALSKNVVTLKSGQRSLNVIESGTIL